MVDRENVPSLRQVVLDCTDATALAEFYGSCWVWSTDPVMSRQRRGALTSAVRTGLC